MKKKQQISPYNALGSVLMQAAEMSRHVCQYCQAVGVQVFVLERKWRKGVDEATFNALPIWSVTSQLGIPVLVAMASLFTT